MESIILAMCCFGFSASFLAAQELREVKLEALALKVPAEWKQQPPSNNLRLGQFSIPAAEGDPEPAELTIFNFGFGGGVKDNIERWVNQFEAKERMVKTTTGQSPQGEYVFVDVQGTYKRPVGPPIRGQTTPAPGFRMLGFILAVPEKGTYFLKLTGPQKTVSNAAEAYRTSIGAKEKDEKPWNSEKSE
jgi:gluconolactonase